MVAVNRLSEYVRLERRWLLLLGPEGQLRWNTIGRVWRILRARIPRTENPGLRVHWGLGLQCWHLHCHTDFQRLERLSTLQQKLYRREANPITFYGLCRSPALSRSALISFCLRVHWLTVTDHFRDQACKHTVRHMVWNTAAGYDNTVSVSSVI